MNGETSWIVWLLVGMVLYQTIRFRIVIRMKNRMLSRKLIEASEKIGTQIAEDLNQSIRLITTQSARLIDAIGLEDFDVEVLLNHPQITDIVITNFEGKIIITNNITWQNTNIYKKFPELKINRDLKTDIQHIDASSYCISTLKEGGELVVIYKMQDIELDI